MDKPQIQQEQCQKEIPVLKSKLKIIGEDEEGVALAVDILTNVFQAAIRKTDDPSNDKQVVDAVNLLIANIRSKDAEIIGAEKGSILISIKCNSLHGLREMMNYVLDHTSNSFLTKIASALSESLQKSFKVFFSMTEETTADLEDWIDNIVAHSKSLVIQLKCKSAQGVNGMFELFEHGQAAESLDELSRALSKSVDSTVKVKATLEMEEFKAAIDSSVQDVAGDSAIETMEVRPEEEYVHETLVYDEEKESEMSKPEETEKENELLIGSDQHFYNMCDSCIKESNTIEANGYCQDCNEYLCWSCIKRHFERRSTNQHTILDPSIMPYTRPPTNRKKMVTKYCQRHEDEIIQYICKQHNLLACDECLLEKHPLCYDVTPISQESTQIRESSELKTMTNDMERVKTILNFVKLKATSNRANICEFQTNASRQIREFISDMHKLLNQIETSAHEHVWQIKVNEIKTFESNMDQCDNLISELSDVQSEVEDLVLKDQNDLLFIAMKNAQKKLSTIKTDVSKVIVNNKAIPYTFQPDFNLENTLRSLSETTSLVSIANPADFKCKFAREINLHSNTDTQRCFILGVIFLPDYRLAVTDLANMSVKVVNIVDSKIESEKVLSSSPTAMTLVETDQLAILMGQEKKIKLVSSVDLSHIRVLTVSHEYNGITYGDERFYAITNKSALHTLDMAGHWLHSINIGSSQTLTQTGICLSPDKTIVYVTDYSQNTVTGTKLDGITLFVYRHRELKGPLGITVAEDGTVYVCSSKSSTIHQLTSHGKLIQFILENEKEINMPLAIAYSELERELVISSGGYDSSNELKIFRLQLTKL